MIAYRACLLALALFTQFVPGKHHRPLAYTTLRRPKSEPWWKTERPGTIIDVREYNEYCPSGHIPCAFKLPVEFRLLAKTISLSLIRILSNHSL